MRAILIWLCSCIGLVVVAPAYTFSPAQIPQTGQATCYDSTGTVIACAGTGQDGELKNGMNWPTPRFIDNGNGTVTDNLTGLIWLKNANCYTAQTWELAVATARTLARGSCGLTDFSTAGMWRLPNKNELESLVNLQESNPANWLNAQGFISVQSNIYWSSSYYTPPPGSMVMAWVVTMSYGGVGGSYKTNNFYVWPVRN